MLLIKAKFIGENGSLGYLKNGKYHLFFSITKSAQVQINLLATVVVKYADTTAYEVFWITGKF